MSNEEIIQRHFLENIGLIRGFIFSLIPDVHRTNDILQDVFMIATRKAGKFQLGTNFPAWVRAIIRIRVLEERRLNAKFHASHMPLDSDLVEALADTSLELDDSWEARREALVQCLEQVAPRAREIMGLRFMEGFSPTEIAKQLSWNVNAVRVALTRVRRSVFECVHRRLTSDGGLK
jgi:RNA polymerase sigma-70 factor, ECF subfamily